MAYRGASLSEDLSNARFETRERVSRRKKLAGYLKAANELRQTYAQSWATRQQVSPVDGSFSDVAAVSNGDEEMIVYPSYAKRHSKSKPEAVPGTIQTTPGAGRDLRDSVGTGDAEFWRQQWDQYENDKAILDVDIRGWLFVPQRGNLTRRQRLMVALARQLVGIPAPATGRNSASSSVPGSPVRGAFQTEEEMAASREADEIVRRGEAEASVANIGGYSELEGGRLRLSRVSSFETMSVHYHSDSMHVRRADLDMANHNLMTRLRPFMANPLPNINITAFFYNEHMSRQRTFTTDASGYFSLRAALDFIPTHVRVLSTEKLSLEAEVNIVEPCGVSVISDIDDTVRHGGITKGAREIFRNAFIRELDELMVPGVRDWYKALADLAVQFHYVSNSPWQLFPVLTQFFSLAGLPLGTFHLKQYSGMLQGIFEPVAERKKAAIDTILRDFPDRRFLLVGDSGEADLEVYTDVASEHPGRIIAILIRDVTTPAPRFFSSSVGASFERGVTSAPRSCPSVETLHQTQILAEPDENSDDHIDRGRNNRKRSMGYNTTSEAESRGQSHNPPKLPPRKHVPLPPPVVEQDLIDLGNGFEVTSLTTPRSDASGIPKRPQTPQKPARLKASPSPRTESDMTHTATADMTASSASHTMPLRPAPPHHMATAPITKPRAAPPLPERLKLTPFSQDVSGEAPDSPRSRARQPSRSEDWQLTDPAPDAKPVLRHKKSGYSIMSDRLSGNWSGSEQDEPPVQKKEEIWKRRLERARQVLGPKGIVLGTWRVGEDVMDDSVAAVKRELAKMGKTTHSD